MASSVGNLFQDLGVAIPGLKSKKPAIVKLLRRPRPPPARNKQEQEDDPDLLESRHTTIYDPQEYNNNWSPVPATPSVVPSLASPMPSDPYGPSRSLTKLSSRKRSRLMRFGSPQRVSSYIKSQQKYILDALYKSHSPERRLHVTPGTLVKTFKPLGPDIFPMRMPKTLPDIMQQYLYFDEVDDMRYYEPCLFTLNEFMIHVSDVHRLPLKEVKHAMFSRHNYKKLTRILAERYIVEKNDSLAVVSMSEQLEAIPAVERRIPGRQILIEMASLVKEKMEVALQCEVKTAIRPLPKYQSPFKPGETPHTEIVVYEETADGSNKLVSFVGESRTQSEHPDREIIESVFQTSTPQYFQDSQRRTNSPFAATGDREISPSELALLDSMVSGGTALSLKAHFISQLPDMSTLSKTITYLNISFNDFRFIPSEVLAISQLKVLKLRDNPIKDIPNDINRLKKLKTLVMSFCLITSLPPNLFKMKKLRHLDLSYNRISFIPNDIKYLKTLRELNLEGNQLPALPCGALRLDLKYLRVANNYMHPLFWDEHTRNQPLRLVDLAANIFIGYQLEKVYRKLPDSVAQILNNERRCDCCKGPMYGIGIRLIRPCAKIFGVKNVPFLFNSCSPQCAEVFRWSTDIDELYGTGDSDDETTLQV